VRVSPLPSARGGGFVRGRERRAGEGSGFVGVTHEAEVDLGEDDKGGERAEDGERDACAGKDLLNPLAGWRYEAGDNCLFLSEGERARTPCDPDEDPDVGAREALLRAFHPHCLAVGGAGEMSRRGEGRGVSD